MAGARQHRAEEGVLARPTKGGAMRTRIALVAILTFAFVTIGTLIQAATPESAPAEAASSRTKIATPVVLDPAQLVSYRGLSSGAPSRSPADPARSPTEPSARPECGTGIQSPHPGSQPHFDSGGGSPTATMTSPTDTVTQDQRAAWQRVALCEEGGDWRSNGPTFSGGLGISRANWRAFGGGEFAPSGAMATEDQQIMVAERIESSPPDQYGCRGW